ncbi:hypothetical protein QNM99_16050 [Pseudomonas sp. PCH446]
MAEHIESTLLGLLDDLTLPERHQAHAEAMRQRLEHGLNWYELLPILDDLAVLMLAINDSGQRDFQIYLKQLNERLESFQSNLQAASAGHAEGRTAANELHSQLREHVDSLQSSVQDARTWTASSTSWKAASKVCWAPWTSISNNGRSASRKSRCACKAWPSAWRIWSRKPGLS